MVLRTYVSPCAVASVGESGKQLPDSSDNIAASAESSFVTQFCFDACDCAFVRLAVASRQTKSSSRHALPALSGCKLRRQNVHALSQCAQRVFGVVTESCCSVSRHSSCCSCWSSHTWCSISSSGASSNSSTALIKSGKCNS